MFTKQVVYVKTKTGPAVPFRELSCSQITDEDWEVFEKLFPSISRDSLSGNFIYHLVRLTYLSKDALEELILAYLETPKDPEQSVVTPTESVLFNSKEQKELSPGEKRCAELFAAGLHHLLAEKLTNGDHSKNSLLSLYMTMMQDASNTPYGNYLESLYRKHV